MWEVGYFFLHFFINYFTSFFPFISDIRDEIIRPRDNNTLEELLNHDSSISEMRSQYNSTLLHRAAAYNSTSCIRVLLRFAPHHLDSVNVHNETPLMYAVSIDSRDAVRMLVRAGADVRVKNNNDRTVFDLARHNKEMLEILKQHQ